MVESETTDQQEVVGKVEGNGEAAAVATNTSKAKAKKKPASKTTEKNETPDANQIFEIDISQIIEDRSPRHEPAQLYDQGWILLGKHPTWEPPAVEEGEEPETRTPLMEMATSKEFDVVRKFVELMEENEGTPDRKENPGAEQSIIELAQDLRDFGQFYPVLIHFINGGLRLIDGGRRVAAKLYWYAKARLDRHDKLEECEWPITHLNLNAINAKNIKKDDVMRIAALVNLSRKQFTPIQEGRMYWDMCQQTNPETGKKFKMNEAAAELHVQYSTFRNRLALAMPFEPAKKDGDGIVVKPAKGLNDNDRLKLQQGKITLTAAMRKALGENYHSADEAPKKKRSGVMTLKEIQKLYDDTPEKKVEIRTLLAKIMGLTPTQAGRESEHRIEAIERREVKEHKKNRKKNAA